MMLNGAPLAAPLPAWVTRVEPDLDGPAATAWKITRKQNEEDPRWGVSLRGWLLLAPWACVAWDWHLLGAVSLQPMEGVPEPRRRYPGAEWDLMCVTVDPAKPPPDPTVDGGEPYDFLLPMDASVQFDSIPEGVAGVERLLEVVARAVTEGRLVPDTDYARMWDSAIRTTLEHVREGRHGL